MKNIYGVNITKGSQKDSADGYVFITNSVACEQSEEIEKGINQINEQNQKASLPGYLNIIMFISLWIGLIIVAAIIKGFGDDKSLATMYNNAPYFFYIGPVCFIIWGILFILKKKKKETVEKSEDLQEVEEYLEEIVKNSHQELGIPENSKTIDVLAFQYKIKKGNIKIISPGYFSFLNLMQNVYIKNGFLCLANLQEELSIPISSIKEINKVKKKATFPDWNKEESYNSKTYKKYKIKVNNYGIFIINEYYSIVIDDALGQFELYIPNYDIDIITELIPIKINENE